MANDARSAAVQRCRRRGTQRRDRLSDEQVASCLHFNFNLLTIIGGGIHQDLDTQKLRTGMLKRLIPSHKVGELGTDCTLNQIKPEKQYPNQAVIMVPAFQAVAEAAYVTVRWRG